MENKQGLFFLTTALIIALVITGLFLPRKPGLSDNIQYTKAMEAIQEYKLGKMPPSALVDLSGFLETAIAYLSFEQGQDPASIAIREGYLKYVSGDSLKRNDALHILFNMIGIETKEKTDLLELAISKEIIGQKDKSLHENNRLSASEASYLLVNTKLFWYKSLVEATSKKEIDPAKYYNKAGDFIFSKEGNILWYRDEGGSLNAINTIDGSFSSQQLPEKSDLEEYEATNNQSTRNIYDNLGILRAVEIIEEKSPGYISDKYILYRENESTDWERLVEFDLSNFKRYEIIGFTQDNEKIYVKTNFFDNYITIYEVDPKNENRQVVYRNRDADVIDTTIGNAIDLEKTDLLHPETGTLLSTSCIDNRPRLVCIDKDFESIMNSIIEVLGKNVFPIEASKDLEYLVIVKKDDTNLGSFYLFNTKTGEYFLLSSPSIEAGSIGITLPVSFKASDGETIFAYLSLPKGKAPEKLPLIIYIHSGPFSRFSITPDAKILASLKNGYAVLSVNSRMSTGYGLEYIEEASSDLMLSQKDIYEATKWAIENNIGDSQKIGIMGADYGGFCAYYQVAAYPDLYKFTIAIRGVWDWNKLGNSLLDEDNDLPFFYKHFAPEIDSEIENILSPSKYVDRIKSDFLIVFSDSDYGQSQEAITDLTLRGINPLALAYEDERSLLAYIDNFLKEKKA